VSAAVATSIGAGDIQLWFKEPRRQGLLSGAVVAGGLPETSGDFLMVVDANMAASKANLHVTKQIDYTVERSRNGRLIGHLRVQIENEAAESGVGPVYNSYLRVYVPAGSTLVASDGHQAANPALDGDFLVFTQPLLVEPKERRSATFDYVLPEAIAQASTYRLTWIRQSGTPGDELRVTVNGGAATADPRTRALRFERDLDERGVSGWLRRRWIVSKLRLSVIRPPGASTQRLSVAAPLR
jgi:hypothetical protein